MSEEAEHEESETLHPMKYRRKFLLPTAETGIGESKSSRNRTGVKMATREAILAEMLSDPTSDESIMQLTKALGLVHMC